MTDVAARALPAPADPAVPGPPVTVVLSLVSHTNVGKTTLARTLLGRDVGEVRDAPHVTEFADGHPLLTSAGGDTMQLWDTPGFGDSARLARRMAQQGSPMGWFLSAVWDRWRDRPFWATQQALRHVRERSDVVLYLVNAAEAPEAAGYVAHEMALLGWVGKPVVVLLNQLGAPRPAADEAADVDRWRRHLATQPLVHAVLPLDAFARCWVQELVLLRTLETVLAPRADVAAALGRLRQAWQARQQATFDASMQVLAGTLARVATTQVEVDEANDPAGLLRGAGHQLGGAVRQLGRALRDRFGAEAEGEDAGRAPARDGALGRAEAALAAEAAAAMREATSRLIALHALQGTARDEIEQRLEAHYERRLRVGEGRAAVWGGVVTGALAGLKADVATGGLTLGGGMLAGGLLGALGAAGVARAVNVVRGTDRSTIGWSPEALDPMVEAVLLRYLAVAHFGRGRGDWAQGESPAHWLPLVVEVLGRHRDTLQGLWRQRSADAAATGAPAAPPDGWSASLQAVLSAAARDALERLYPGARPFEAAPTVAGNATA